MSTEPSGTVSVRLGERTVLAVQNGGPAVRAWMSGLLGTNPLEECLQALTPMVGGRTRALEIMAALDRSGALLDARSPRPVALQAEEGQLRRRSGGAESRAVISARQRAAVTVHGAGDLTHQLAGLLRTAGTGTVRVSSRPPTERGQRDDLAVILARPGFRRTATRILDEPLLASGQPYIGVGVGLWSTLASPLVRPGASACLGCAALHDLASGNPPGGLPTGSCRRMPCLPDLPTWVTAIVLGHVTRTILAALDLILIGVGGEGRILPAPAILVDHNDGSCTVRPWVAHPACQCVDPASAA